MVVVLGGMLALLPQARLAVAVTTRHAGVDRRDRRLAERCSSTSPRRRARQRDRAQADAGDRQPVRDDDVRPAARASSSTRCRAATTSTRSTPRRRGHATELCREAAPRATTSWSPSAATAPSTRPANGLAGTDTPLTCLPGGATNVYCTHARHPRTTSSTPPSTCSRLADAWAPRSVDLGIVNGRRFTFSAGLGPRRRAWSSASTRHPQLKARFGPWYFAYAGDRDVPARVRRPPAAARRRGRGGETRRAASPRSSRTATPTRTSRAARSTSPRTSSSTTARSPAACCSARAPLDVPTVMARLFSDAPRIAGHRRVFAFERPDAPRVRSADGRPDPAPGRRRLRRRHGRGGLRRPAGRADGRLLSAAGTVRVWRGGHVESVHRFAWRLREPDGTVRGGGDIGPVFLRSAAKPFQALPAVRAGVLERFKLTPRHLAVACASHGGDGQHLSRVAEILLACGVGESALGCGPLLPRDPSAAAALKGRPHRIHHNCSGKHALGLALCVVRGLAARGLPRRRPPAPGGDARRDPRGHRRERRRRRRGRRRLRDAHLRDGPRGPRERVRPARLGRPRPGGRARRRRHVRAPRPRRVPRRRSTPRSWPHPPASWRRSGPRP